MLTKKMEVRNAHGMTDMDGDTKLMGPASIEGAADGETGGEQLVLSLDAFVRSVGVRRTSPLALFLGAGTSTSSGVPSAQTCIWEWKRRIFLTKNPGLEEQFAELSLDGIRRKIQRWLDTRGTYPVENTPDEYGFYINECFPIPDDRRSFFAEQVRDAMPHIGYRLLCHLAEADLIRSVWSTNFDSLAARAAANFKLSALEIGIDTKNRAGRAPKKGELLCVSMHGDYRYDALKNTSDELQHQEAALRQALIAELRDTSLVVTGYSGRDQSVMRAFHDAYATPGTGTLYWCGFSDNDIPAHIQALIRHARASGRQAFYVPTLGFDDMLTRLALHCLHGESRKAAARAIEELAPADKLTSEPWQLPACKATTLIKSNSFSVECPSELLCFDLKEWPKEKVWSYLRDRTANHQIAAVPLKGKMVAFGAIDAIKEVFADNLKGDIERTPVGPKDLLYEDGAIVSLMREALTRSMADAAQVCTDGLRELWMPTPREDQRGCRAGYKVFDSLHLFLRRIGGAQFLVLKPSIKVLDNAGNEAAREVANPIKLAILGYQHNKPFNRAIMAWRKLLFPGNREAVFDFPRHCGSSFKFKVRRSPVFGEIGLPQGGPAMSIPSSVQPLIKYSGVQLGEPDLVFSNKAGTGLVRSPHPIRGIAENRPYDYPLTLGAHASTIRVGIVCPSNEAAMLRDYLLNLNRKLAPTSSERDYLVDYPGFQSAFGVPVEVAEPDGAGWFTCPEPSSPDAQANALELCGHINRGIQSLESSYAPHVVLVFFPDRWREFRGYQTDAERFDVHDFVKAFCVQRGIATQFLAQDTLADRYQCRVWWWLSLALYVKAMRTPWVKHPG